MAMLSDSPNSHLRPSSLFALGGVLDVVEDFAYGRLPEHLRRRAR
jgi:hypothetical protein